MTTDGTIAVDAVRYSFPGEWPSGKATDFESVALPENGKRMLEQHPPRYVNLVTWVFAPEWLTVEQACFLSGYDRGFLRRVIEVDGVDLDDTGRIEKRSLWEWLEVSVELAHWNDQGGYNHAAAAAASGLCP